MHSYIIILKYTDSFLLSYLQQHLSAVVAAVCHMAPDPPKLLVLIESPWNAMRNWMGVWTLCSGWIELTLTGRLNSPIQWIYQGTDDVNIFCCTILPDHQAYCDLYFVVIQVIFYYNTFFLYNSSYLAYIALVSFKHQEMYMFGFSQVSTLF